MEIEIQPEEPKSKKGLIIILILLILVFLGVIIVLVLTNCTVKNMIGLGLNCYINKAVSENNVSICKELSRNSQVSTCYKQYAIIKKDTSVCNIIPNGLEMMPCYQGIAQISSNRITLCNNPEGVANTNCYTAFLEIKDSIEECNILSGRNKDMCYRFFAYLKKNFQLCNSIIDADEKNTCVRDAWLDTVSKETSCADSDGGINNETKGWVMDNVENAVYEDQCLGSSLIEHYCENNRHQQKEIPCSCSEGICP